MSFEHSEWTEVNHPIFREPTAELLCKEIENFRHRICGFHEPLATEFRAAAVEWLKIARRQLDEAKAVLSKEPTPQILRVNLQHRGGFRSENLLRF